MKKIKIVLWIIIIGFLALVMFQNKDFFYGEAGIRH